MKITLNKIWIPIVLVLSSLSSANLKAEACWKPVMQNTNGMLREIDTCSMIAQGKIIKAWTRDTFISEQTLPSGKIFSYQLIRNFVNCGINESSIQQSTHYSSDGEVVESNKWEDVKYSAYPPDTLGDKTIRMACSHSKKIPSAP